MGLEEEKLHRYFDGELEASEAEEVRLAVEASEEERAKLERLERLHALIAMAAGDAAEDLSSDDLFAKVRDGIEGKKAAAPLRVIEGEARPTRVEGWKIGLAGGMGLAVAAAVLLFVLAGTPEVTPTATTTPGEPEIEIAQTEITTIEGPQGSEVEEVDFGGNTGTIFAVEGEAGEPIAVVWINDEPAEQVQ